MTADDTGQVKFHTKVSGARQRYTGRVMLDDGTIISTSEPRDRDVTVVAVETMASWFHPAEHTRVEPDTTIVVEGPAPSIEIEIEEHDEAE